KARGSNPLSSTLQGPVRRSRRAGPWSSPACRDAASARLGSEVTTGRRTPYPAPEVRGEDAMAVNLRGRSLLSLVEETPKEIRYLLDLAHDLKRAKYARQERQLLRGRSVALVFEKTSTRTRAAFEVAATDQGASTTFLDPSSTQIGHKESIKDTARVLGRMYDAIQYRGSSQAKVEQLAEHAGVPVYNGLTDEWHPTQMLADALTMAEHTHKHRHEIAYAYVGDARNN